MQTPALYQKLSKRITQLRILGFSIKEIANQLNVSEGTIENALKWASLPTRLAAKRAGKAGRLIYNYPPKYPIKKKIWIKVKFIHETDKAILVYYNEKKFGFLSRGYLG